MKVSKGEIFERLFVNEPELNLHIEQEAGSQVKLYVINFEISGYRNTEISNKISVEQLGEGCTTEIYALAYLHGEESVTTETHVKHAVGGGASNQLIKFVLDDEARGRFIGDLKIDQDAQKTEAHQTNRNLLLSETAEMRTQPQLEIYALAYLKGDEKVTTETHVTHAVGGGKSEQLIKFVLDDNARGRFIGDLKIAPDAQQTEAHQTNRNLLLSEAAEMRTQPQLEIYADDVQATHGASTGQLDESALFYMQQRGIDKQKARQLLVGAFMREVLDKIPHSLIPHSLNPLLDAIDGVVE